MTLDDSDRSPLEQRLLALLEPDAAAVQRIKEKALSAPTPHRSIRFLAIAAGLLAWVGTCVVWQVGTRQPQPPAVVTIEQSENDLMLARTPDGRLWVLGRAEKQGQSPGTMEVVLEGGR